MTLQRCPQCSAPMRTDYIGALSDKVLRCDYCGTIVDVPDQSTVEQSTTTHEVRPGRMVTTTRKKVVTRRDGFGERSGGGDAAAVEIDVGNRKQAIRQLRDFVRGHGGDAAALDIENVDLLIEDLTATEAEVPDELLYQLQGLLREGTSASLDIGGLIRLSRGSGSIKRVVDSHEITLSTSAARRHRAGAARPPLWMVVVAVTVTVIIAIAILG